METENLFTGIAVVIDDEIGKEKAIDNLISQIKKKNMPCLTYTELPGDAIIDHFDNISFLLLDWKLQAEILGESITDGVTLPSTIRDSAIEENISFLKKLRESCFMPVFIFTNEKEEVVIQPLKDHGLYQDDKPNYIFVKRKSDLTGRTRLFKTIEDWIRKTPSIYVLTAWDKAYRTSKAKLFYDFYNISPNWPNIMWKSFDADGVNMSLELGEVITRNLHTRMMPFAFDENILKKRIKKTPKDEVRKVLEGERFITKEGLDKDTICTGDIFKISGKIYINIRPECDCIPRKRIADNQTEDVELYLLKGEKLKDIDEKKIYRKKYGNFEEIDNQSIIFSIIHGKTFDFKFQKLSIKNWSDIKDKRIGRLLPPYITRIQQRYALYLQRQGLPHTPKQAIYGS